MSKRRGKRIVVGYVVSHTGKRGGPWEAEHENGHRAFRWGVGTDDLPNAARWSRKDLAEEAAAFVRRCMSPKPHARALPLVRYEVDAEEERLRDAVVEAAKRAAESGNAWVDDLDQAVRALRAHREKVGR